MRVERPCSPALIPSCIAITLLLQGVFLTKSRTISKSWKAWSQSLRGNSVGYLWMRRLFSLIWGYLCGGNGVSVLPYAHPQLFKVFKHLIYVWHRCGMQFERFYSLNDSVVGSFPHITSSRISASSPKSGDTSVVVTVWVCCHMPNHNCSRCSNTLYMYDMDVGCSLKGSIASTIV